VATLLSGAAALVFQTLWVRAFELILGSTVYAAAAVFAAFLTGLALGAGGAGRLASRLTRPGLAYVVLELGIGVTASLAGLWLHGNALQLADVFARFTESGKAGPAYLIALGLTGGPALLMGATFPLLVTLSRHAGAGTGAISLLYAANVLGAALGTLLCGFVLIRLVGVHASLLVAAGLNGLSALACLPFLRQRSVATAAPVPAPASGPTITRPLEAALLGTAFLSGFLVLSLEIVWVRYAGFFLGNRTFAFSLLLATVLVLLAGGSWLASGILRRQSQSPAATLAGLFVLSAVGVALSTALVNGWIARQSTVEALLPGGPAFHLYYRALQALGLLAPALLPLGALFPLALSYSRLAARDPGSAAGRFYLVNTAGAVLGSLATGFAGLSALGANGCATLLAWLALGAGGLALLVARPMLAPRQMRAGVLVSVAGLAAVSLTLPRQPLRLVEPGEELLDASEDAYGVFQIRRAPGGSVKVSNNRTQLIFNLGPVLTSYVQQMQGHLGVWHRPDARTAVVLGSGYGITAGALTRYPQLTRIDAVEILPALARVTDRFALFTYDYRRDPRVRLVVDDGRHFLVTARVRYDIISANVSDPHLPGGAALFHREFYELTKTRLAPRGVLLQHAFGTELATVLATVRASFAHVRLYPAYANGFNVVASDAPLEVDLARVTALGAEAGTAKAWADIGLVPPFGPEIVLRHPVTPALRPDLFDLKGPIATDDRPVIEFAWSASGARLLFSNE
jgi:predicted membrane-bound spermidine synthase